MIDLTKLEGFQFSNSAPQSGSFYPNLYCPWSWCQQRVGKGDQWRTWPFSFILSFSGDCFPGPIEPFIFLSISLFHLDYAHTQFQTITFGVVWECSPCVFLNAAFLWTSLSDSKILILYLFEPQGNGSFQFISVFVNIFMVSSCFHITSITLPAHPFLKNNLPIPVDW
jgi:hypothetical protein